MGGQANTVYIIDFGLSKEFRDPHTHVHIPDNVKHDITGTPLFASARNHVGGHELSRRDDLESLAYVLIYFLRGSLPWQNKTPMAMVKAKKKTSRRDLCHGLPEEFYSLLEHIGSLSFDERPNYNYLIGLFEKLLSRDGFQNAVFDWAVDSGEDTLRHTNLGKPEVNKKW